VPIARIIFGVALLVLISGCITEPESPPDSAADLTSLPDLSPPNGASSLPSTQQKPVPAVAFQSPAVVESKTNPSGPSDKETKDRGAGPLPADVKSSNPNQTEPKKMPDWKAKIIRELEKTQSMEAASRPPTTQPKPVAAVPPPKPAADPNKAAIPGPGERQPIESDAPTAMYQSLVQAEVKQLPPVDTPKATRTGLGDQGPGERGSPQPSETLNPAAPTQKLMPVEGSLPHIVDTSASHLIGPGDLLNIRVAKIKELTTEGRVNQAGAIVMPVVGPVQVAGLTPSQAREHITKFLATDYVVNPLVELDVKK
jgi:hypothetical protein